LGAKSEGRKFLKDFSIDKKVKEPRNRPGVALRVPEVSGSQILMTFGT
jgi:hypothetical protein